MYGGNSSFYISDGTSKSSSVKERKKKMENEFQEYITFSVTASEGKEIEMAVMEEFEFEKKNYVAAARIIGDMIDEEGIYIYRCRLQEDGFSAEKITDPKEYQKVAQAYMEL